MGFKEILEYVRDETSPKLRFGKVLAGKSILWMDCTREDKESERAKLRKTMSATSKRVDKCRMKVVRNADEVLTELGRDNSKEYDLVIITCDGDNGGVVAFKVLQRINEIRYPSTDTDTSNSKSPMVIVHADYEADVSEEMKGKVMRMGAFEYTTDIVSLASVILRAFTIYDQGGDRKHMTPVPGKRTI